MFQHLVTINPHKDGIHCGSCHYHRGDGFRGICWLFDHAECPHDPDWKSVKRCDACLKAEKDSTTTRTAP